LGWQLDNELSHYGRNYDYSEVSQQSSRWLKTKYGSIENLNRIGVQRSVAAYQNFDQIRMPNEREYVAQFNPHAMLDLQRWFAAEAPIICAFKPICCG